MPAASSFAGGGCLSIIIWALCRWTMTLIEAGRGSAVVRLSLALSPASLASGFGWALQLFIVVIFLMVAHRFNADGPKAPVDSRMKGWNSYLSLSKSQYLALFLVSACLAVWPGPFRKCLRCVGARGLTTETSTRRCFVPFQLYAIMSPGFLSSSSPPLCSYPVSKPALSRALARTPLTSLLRRVHEAPRCTWWHGCLSCCTYSKSRNHCLSAEVTSTPSRLRVAVSH